MAGSHALWQALEERGVTRLVFVRHANAARPDLQLPGMDRAMLEKAAYQTPHEWKREDQMRPITEKGKEQATAARAWFDGEPLRLNHHAALVASGARRAVETLQVMAETRTGDQGSAEVLLCPSLHPAGIAPEMEKLFDKLGYGPLKKFWDAGGEKPSAAYADLVAGELANVLRGGEAKGSTVSVFGHAVFLNCVAYACAYWIRLSQEDLDRLASIDLGEAEGLLLERAPASEPNGFGSLHHLHLRAS